MVIAAASVLIVGGMVAIATWRSTRDEAVPVDTVDTTTPGVTLPPPPPTDAVAPVTTAPNTAERTIPVGQITARPDDVVAVDADGALVLIDRSARPVARRQPHAGDGRRRRRHDRSPRRHDRLDRRSIGGLVRGCRHDRCTDPAAAAAGMDGIVSGVLSYDGTCLSLAEPGVGPWPVTWPFGTTWNPEQPAVVLPDGRRVAIGDRVDAGGGMVEIAATGAPFQDALHSCVEAIGPVVGDISSVETVSPGLFTVTTGESPAWSTARSCSVSAASPSPAPSRRSPRRGRSARASVRLVPGAAPLAARPRTVSPFGLPVTQVRGIGGVSWPLSTTPTRAANHPGNSQPERRRHRHRADVLPQHHRAHSHRLQHHRGHHRGTRHLVHRRDNIMITDAADAYG